ncbi:MAG TPA: hypothetical protein VLG28_07470 [Acidimicrobiia bacterium]|nr:hypothetical protein [Acidimicrobiia bacterium]
MRHRQVLVTLGAILALSTVAGPAFAEDLEDYLEKAADADYAGTRVVVTVWQGRSVAEMTRVEHSSDVMMLGAPGFEAVIVDGKVARGEDPGVALAGWSAVAISDRYTVGAVAEADRLGRAAHAVQILEEGVLRARIVFDSTTWAPLVTEIFDDQGTLFRIASFTDFDPHPRRVYEEAGDAGRDYEVVTGSSESSLPATAAGYSRVDMYADADGVHQAFFSDGFFSFSVFEVAPRQVRQRFDGAATITVEGADYRVMVRPSELWVAWEHGPTGYVLVGDLPPDHLRDVLGDLPEPRQKGLWERIFGFFG